MTKDKSRIQSCVDHINTAVDVDPWAKELVAEMGKEILKAQLSKEDATSDCISRQAALELGDNLRDDLPDDEQIAAAVMAHNEGIIEYQTKLSLLPSVQPTHTNTSNTLKSLDCVDRQDAIDAVKHAWAKGLEPSQYIEELPSVQPEPLSDAYMKAVWTWLLDYQIKAAELKGRYTPYEVLSWVANDWRKEHE